MSHCRILAEGEYSFVCRLDLDTWFGVAQDRGAMAGRKIDPVEKLVAQSMKGLAAWARRPTTVRFREMVRSGLIDEEGKVRHDISTKTLGDLTTSIEKKRRLVRRARLAAQAARATYAGPKRKKT